MSTKKNEILFMQIKTASLSNNTIKNNDIENIQNKLKIAFYFDRTSGTMPKPTNQYFSDIVEELKKNNISQVISLDLQNWEYTKFSEYLADSNIEHIHDTMYEIPDFYSLQELQPNKIDTIVNATLPHRNVMFHCLGGNGRSSVMCLCRFMKIKKMEGADLNRFDTTSMVKGILNKHPIKCNPLTNSLVSYMREKNPYAFERNIDIQAVEQYRIFLNSIN
jgi:hypothetical protein